MCISLIVWQEAICAQEGPARAARERALEREAARKSAERETKSRATAMGTKRSGDTGFNSKPTSSLSPAQLKQAIEAARPAVRAGAGQMRDVPAGTNVSPAATPKPSGSGSTGQGRGRTPGL